MTDNEKIISGKSRRLRMSGYSLFITIAVIAAAVIVNLIINALPFRYTMIDLTGSGVYKISDRTKEFLDSLTEDITIYFITTDTARDYQLSSFLEVYTEASPRIKVVEVDPNEEPSFIEKHGVETMNSLVVEGAKRTETVDYYDIYEFSEDLQALYYSDYNNFIYGIPIEEVYDPDLFDADNEITSAIDYVTTDNLPITYMLTGHGEIDMPGAITSYIDANNVSMGDLNLLAIGSVPGDASVIVINVPSVDIRDSELSSLTEFIDGGGKVIIVTDVTSYDTEEMPNLTALAAHCGLKAIDGVVLEGDSQRYNSSDPFTLMEPLQECVITADISNPSRYSVLMSRAHAIVKDDAYEGSMSVRPIIGTSSDAYIIDKDEAYRESAGDDEKGEFWLGAIARDEASGAALIWYSTSSICASAYAGYNNGYIFMASVVTICDKPMTITIDSVRTESTGKLIFTETNANTLTAIIQYVIPAAILIFGFVVWLRRRLR